MDNYSVKLIKKSKVYDITPVIGNLSWRSNIDALGVELSFEKANSTDNLFPKFSINLGDFVILENNKKEIFRGIVTDESKDGIFNRSYVCYDFAFYLNKSKTIAQFKKARADSAIKQLCDKFSIPIGEITPMGTLISGIYFEKTVAEIIEDILSKVTKETGIKFRKEMRYGKFYIQKYTDLVVKATFKPAENVQAFDITKAIGSVSVSRSIADLKNSIQIISGSEKSTRVVATSESKESIAKYGLLQEVESIDEKDIAQARNIAKNRLAELNRIAESTSIELLGSDEVMAGRILELNEPITGLKGRYLVNEASHSYSNSIHKMQLSIEVV